MARAVSVLIWAIALIGAVAPLPWDGPRPTTEADNALNTHLGWSLKPTQAPILDAVKRDGVLNLIGKRSAHTCGYYGGNINDPFICDNDGFCLANRTNSAFGCCVNPSGCDFSTGCVASTDYYNGLCNRECMTDTQIAKCTIGKTTECGTLFYARYTEVFVEYFCAPISFTTDVDFHAFSQTPSPISPIPSTRSVIIIPPIDSKTRTYSTQPIPTTPLTSSISATTSAPPSSGGGNSTPVGAIAGGVVGGVVVIAAIGIIAWIIIRNRKRKIADHGTTDQNEIVGGGASTQQMSNPGASPISSQPMSFGTSEKLVTDQQQKPVSDQQHLRASTVTSQSLPSPLESPGAGQSPQPVYVQPSMETDDAHELPTAREPQELQGSNVTSRT